MTVTQTRAAVKDQQLAEWGLCDVVRFVQKQGDPRGTINAVLAGGEVEPTDAERKPVADAIEAMLVAVRARIASGRAAGPMRLVDPESQTCDNASFSARAARAPHVISKSSKQSLVLRLAPRIGAAAAVLMLAIRRVLTTRTQPL